MATEKQLSFGDDEVIRILNSVYVHFREGRFSDATEKLERALRIDFEYPGITSSLKCADFWQERVDKLPDLHDAYEKGEYLLGQWRHFAAFKEKMADISEQCIFSLKTFVFSQALQNFLQMYEESGIYDCDVLLRIGRCYKGFGDYERAIEFLEKATQQKSDNPEIMAELADCYALVDEIRASKAFFREAFFLNPHRIDLANLESAFIHKLVKKLVDRGYRKPDLLEWIPVYATVYGIFNVKRELRPIEYGKLKQRIFKYENEIKQGKEGSGSLIPRLINHYFWLIDHYVSAGEEKARIDEVLEKIKDLDPNIYHEYAQ